MPHRPLRFLFQFLAPLVLSSSLMLAQDSADVIRAGLGAEIPLVGGQSGSFNVYAGDSCGTFGNGSLIILENWSVGASGAWKPAESSWWGAGAKLLYRKSKSRYTETPAAAQRLLDPNTSDVIELDREFRFESTISYLDLSLEGLIYPVESVRVGFGTFISGAISSSFAQTDNILGPEDRSFSDGETIHPMDFGIAVSNSPVVFGLTGSIGWELALRNDWVVIPRIGGRYDLTSTVRQASWMSWSLNAGVSLHVMKFAAGSPDPTPPSPPPPPSPDPPTASIVAEGIDEQGHPSNQATISVREVLLIRSTPLVPSVFFDSGSVSLPREYVPLDRQSARTFGLREVAELDPIHLSHRILDIVAYRMHNDTAARLHLYGMTSSDEPPATAGMRARAVRDYLIGVWRIEGRRIEIRTGQPPVTPPSQATPDGREENRRVALGSNSPYLLGSLVTERLAREFNPPILRLIPEMRADAGVRKWRVSVLKDGVELAGFSGDGPFHSGDDSLVWQLDDTRIDSSLGLLIASIEVTDSLGRVASARDTVELHLKKESSIARSNTERRGELERQIVELAGFDYRSGTGNREHASQIASLSSTIRAGATIAVTGYTDRIGDDEANHALSRERAEWVAGRIREELTRRGVPAGSIRTRGEGLVPDRFSNDTPEGRILSRGVQVIVEQPFVPDGKR